MGVTQIRGIVIAQRSSGESSKQIFVLAKGMGKVMLSARGARNTKSRLLAGTQMFAYCDFTVFEGRGFYSLTQVDMIESFYGLRSDMERLAEAVYLAELVERTSPPGLEVDEALKLLLTTLSVLEKSGLSPGLISRIFEVKYLQISGVLASAQCGMCESELVLYNNTLGAFVCEAHGGGVPISAAVRRALAFVLENDGRDMFRFEVSPAVLEELDWILGEYIKIHLHIHTKSRAFRKTLEMN